MAFIQKYYQDILPEIKKLYAEGNLDPQIAEILNIPRRTIGYLRKKYLETSCIRNTKNDYTLNPQVFKENLLKSNLELVSDELIQLDKKHKGYKVRCKNCGKEFIKDRTRIGKTGCQCVKAQRPAKNYNGHKDLSYSYFKSIKSGAGIRNLVFEITMQDIWDLFIKQDRKCKLSGLILVIDRNYRRNNKTTASLDRIDSNKGYTLDNIQWIHKDLNKMKMNYSNEYFIEMCRLIANNNKK